MARIARKYLETEYCHIMVQEIEKNYIWDGSVFAVNKWNSSI